jgi:hypothetical protein
MVSLREGKSQSIAYLLNGSEHVYWILDLETEVHSIWVMWTSNLQECQGQARVGIGQGRGTKALTFSVLPLPITLTRATLDMGI